MIVSKTTITDERFGLEAGDLGEIIKLLEKEPAVEEALIFGSRAKGNFRRGSDIDIALKGKLINPEIINTISFVLNEETLMPYYFDIIDYDKISNENLKKHIDRVGIVFYLAEASKK